MSTAPSGDMTPQEMRDRTDRFAIQVVIFCRALPGDNLTRRLAGQLQDAGTSVAANYRAACRARSRREFVAKLSIAVEEADESVLWLKTLQKSGVASGDELIWLQQEAAELLSILSASRRTASRT
jgi:four helix bundle protein